ncbi:MAG: HAMP domain-containing histidine kinase [Anaerolineales bacterium]|nr:HAMP domain-containing histidine kinase [Anaerolineales bacterium]
MSLRLRLTLLYTSMLGGILLVFGTLIYFLVGDFLVNQIDRTLANTVKNILANARVTTTGDLNMLNLAALEMSTSVHVQYWDWRGNLKMVSPGISEFEQPLDEQSLLSPRPVYRHVYSRQVHWRVLTAPLVADNRPAGVVQVATNLNILDSIQRTLLVLLIFLTVFSMVVAAVASWLSIGQALAPLQTVTRTAEQITRADDLSRRIPYSGPEHDEIGTLIRAFNRTFERLETLFTAQQRFLADVSHELRTPLTVIKGNADLIRKIGPDEESLNSIKDEADRLTRMVEDLLLLAQAESGKLPLNLRTVMLDELLTDVFQEMRVLAGDKVHLKLTEIDQVTLSGDRDRLKQVFINLIANAIHYSPIGGDVYIGLSRSQEMARVIIRDMGPGIPAKDLPHIFDRFYRGEKSRTRSKTSGFGLGLSIAYFLVDAHGGRIEVNSQEGRGTTFAVYLPLSTE